MLIGTISYYHFIQLSVTLTFTGGHKVSAKHSLLASFSFTLFDWWGWYLVWCWTSSNWIFRYYFVVTFNETREMTPVLLCKNNFSVGMHSDIYELIWFKCGVMIDTIELYILILVYYWAWPQCHRSVRKQKLLHQLSHKGNSWFALNLVYCVRLVGLMILILHLSCPFIIQWGESYLCNFISKKTLNVS